MKERPILFKGPLVRAILSGQKTVTRRVIKQAAGSSLSVELLENGQALLSWLVGHGPGYEVGEQLKFVDCPYGVIGDRLWVRETWGLQVRDYGGGTGEHIVYRATNPDAIYCKSAEGQEYPVKWKPSIHMPRHSSRILLEITDVRVEQLQDITPDQCIAEGVDAAMCRQFLEIAPSRHTLKEAEIHGFSGLWNSVGGDWNANPWVWVVEFKRVTPP
ncbi:Phage protein [Pseudomonas synxantha]|uniref:Phage protein n=1 Tax=Pseudomonas synxantha TaxID=47883 RepID=A0A3G7U237_9PSED|nr:hypothetical protein [Pseudomonas synxantha]AZE53435.1 Phage protein [Pseudomonas synxantha]